MTGLLKRLIATPSVSRQESGTADILMEYLLDAGIKPHRHINNVWAVSKHFDPDKPTLLLNSHHDTVKPTSAWTLDPFTPTEKEGRIYGLGSNDAGGAVVALIATFLHYHDKPLHINLMLAITAEEEVSGKDGMSAMVDEWKRKEILPTMGIVGEPTQMQAAIGERGLVVLDCVAHARGGHTAREEGENALYKAVDDINRLRNLTLPTSSLLGNIKVTATQIEAGVQHNVLPQECRYVLDVRTTDALTNEETVHEIRRCISSQCTPRSTRLRASAIAESHPLVQAAAMSGASAFVSQTMSDMALLPMVDTMKIGPGKSQRSHTPDEYICIEEIEEGIKQYKQIIENLNEIMGQGL